MASNGSFNTTSYGSYGRYVNFSWSIKSQSIENNETVISWTLKGAGGSSTTNYYNSGPVELTINGSVVYTNSTRFELRNGTVIKTGETTIKHNTDGTKTFSASCKIAIYDASYNCSGSGSWTLTQIPRQATLTAAPSLWYDTDNPSITYSNPAGNAITKLEACITNSSNGGIVGYREISKTGTSYTFNLTAAEKTALYKACSTSNYMSVKFFIRTTIGSTYYYSEISSRFAIKDGEPVLAPTAKDTLAASLALTGSNNIVILGYNTMSLAVNATPRKEATITSYKITCLDKTLTTATGTMSNVESATFTFEATDSRGNTGYEVLSLSVVQYIYPTCNIGTTSFNTSGAMSVAVSGKFYNNTFGATTNTLTLQYRLKENSGSWGSWTTVSATKSGNSYSATISKTGLNYQSNYEIEVKATDKISSKSATKSLRALPVWEFGPDCFQINATHTFGNIYGLGRTELIPGNSDLNDPKYRVPGVYGVNGHATAKTIKNMPRYSITTAAESQDEWRSAGKLIVYSPMGTAYGGSASYHYIVQEYISLDGKEPNFRRTLHTSAANEWVYGPWTRDKGAELLWSGANAMGSGTTITLNNLISYQPNGIVLRFCGYSGSAATNENFQEFFIPRDFATRFPGKSHTFTMATSSFGSVATKLVYIKEYTENNVTKAIITGYANNTATGTTNGITYNNNAFCLREVIGV